MDELTGRHLAQLLRGRELPRPAYRSLATAIRTLVVDGRVLPGTRLPSERDLVATLGLSRATITNAYRVLQEQGYLVSRRGSGSVASLPDDVQRTDHGTGLLPGLGFHGDVLDMTFAATRAPSGVAEAYARAVEELPAHVAGPGYLTLGMPRLRAAIAARYTRRGLPTSPDEVLVTSGAVTAMAIAARALLSAGDHVLLETPTYPNTIATLRHARARLHPTPVTTTGWDLDGIETVFSRHPVRAAALIPDFHNPTGALLDAEGRERLGGVLRRRGAVALCDETIAEVCFGDGPQPPPFGAFHRDTVSIGSTSKTWWGGLRIGWLRAPRRLTDALVQARMGIDLGAPVLEQLVVAQLLEGTDGAPAEHLTGLRNRRDLLAAELAQHLPQARFELPTGGLFLWVQVPGVDMEQVAQQAAGLGLAITPGSRFAVVGRLDRWLRLPFSAPEDQLRLAVQRLARAVGLAQASVGTSSRRAQPPVVA